jgi:hypothetical protein
MEDFGALNLVGRPPAFLGALELMRKSAGCDATVLLQGETGTGKEMAARAIHHFGTRRTFPFIPVNCGALPENLVERALRPCPRRVHRRPRRPSRARRPGARRHADPRDGCPRSCPMHAAGRARSFRYRGRARTPHQDLLPWRAIAVADCSSRAMPGWTGAAEASRTCDRRERPPAAFLTHRAAAVRRDRPGCRGTISRPVHRAMRTWRRPCSNRRCRPGR